MASVPVPRLVISVLFAVFSTVLAVQSYFLLGKLRDNEKVAKASFQLRPSEYLSDFHVFLAASIVNMAGLVSYTFGSIMEISAVVNAGRTIFVLYLIVSMNVFYRWMRRF